MAANPGGRLRSAARVVSLVAAVIVALRAVAGLGAIGWRGSGPRRRVRLRMGSLVHAWRRPVRRSPSNAAKIFGELRRPWSTIRDVIRLVSATSRLVNFTCEYFLPAPLDRRKASHPAAARSRPRCHWNNAVAREGGPSQSSRSATRDSGCSGPAGDCRGRRAGATRRDCAPVDGDCPEPEPPPVRPRVCLTNRLRTEGTDNLLAAARAAGVRRVVAQSFAGWTYERAGGPVKTEQDPLDPSPPPGFRRTLDAIRTGSRASGRRAYRDDRAALRLVLRSSNISRPGQRAPRCDSTAATADRRRRRWDLVFYTYR